MFRFFFTLKFSLCFLFRFKTRLPRLTINEPPPAYKKHPSATSSEYETHNAVNSYLEEASHSNPVVGFPYRISSEKCRQLRDKNTRNEDEQAGHYKQYKEPNLGRPLPPPNKIQASEYESIELNRKRRIPKDLIYHNPNVSK